LPHRKEPPAIPPPEHAETQRKFYKVKCPGCKTIIVVTSQERPLKIKCANCGKEGVLK
jgi:ribosomal protein S27E